MTTVRRRGLGRGLDALLSPTTRPMPVEEVGDDLVALTEVPVDAIARNPEQPRTEFDDAALGELADSIRTHGLLQPIVVERDPRSGFRLIAGERRLRAARRAGLTVIPAVVRPASESNRVALELALIENLQRADLTPIEEATAFQRLGDAFGLTAEAIGLRVGRSRPAVTNTLRLLSLPPAVQTALRERRLSAGHGRALLALADPAEQESLARHAEAEALSVRDVERAVAQRLTPAPANGGTTTVAAAATPRGGGRSNDPGIAAHDAAVCRGLEEALGTPVRIERRRRGGRLVVDFYADDQLDGLYRALGGRPL